MIAVRPILATPAVLALTTRIRQDIANPDEIAPYLVWTRLTVVPELTLMQRPPGDRETIRVDVLARSEAERDALTVAVRDALEGHGHVTNIQSLGQDADTYLWRMTMDSDLFQPR